MKVRLATETFSTSVADAMKYCRKKLNLSDFQHNQSTECLTRNLNNKFNF